MHGVHPELLQVADGPRLGEGEEFARMLRTNTFHSHVGVEVDVAGDGEVAVVHLVDDEVGGRPQWQSFVVLPSRRIGGAQVEHIAAPAVHTHRPGADTRCFHPLFAVAGDIKGVVVATPVAAQGGAPHTVEGSLPFQSHGAHGFAAHSLLVEAEHRFFCIGRGNEEEESLVEGGIVVTAVAHQGSLCLSAQGGHGEEGRKEQFFHEVTGNGVILLSGRRRIRHRELR